MKPLVYRTLIVDDEEHCRQALQRIAGQYCPRLRVVASVESVAEARVSLLQHQPDLILLDVEMPDEDGFDLLEQLGSGKIPVIFTTAHERYALKALKNQARDYLLKPVDPKDLMAAVNKLENPVAAAPAPDTGKVAFPTLSGFIFCYPEEIIRCEADGAYTRIVRIEGAPLLVSRNIGYVENILGRFSFFRIHKSHLVNLAYVREYIRGKGGIAVMDDHTQVEVSKRRREDFLLAISR